MRYMPVAEVEAGMVLGQELLDGEVPEVGQDDIIDVARRMAEELLAGKEQLYNRMDIRAAGDYAFFHAVNVAALSAMLGIQAGNLDLEELRMLTAAGLVHDVGRRYVEEDVLNAKRVLAEEERLLVVQHAKLSCDFLEEHYGFGPELLDGVLEHHEWYNGCGYCLTMTQFPLPVRWIIFWRMPGWSLTQIWQSCL